MGNSTRSPDLVSPRTPLPPSLKKKQRIKINSLRIRCASRHRIWMTCSTLGSSLGTPWEHPGVQGPEIDDSGRQLESIFDVRRNKSGSKSTLRASQKLIPTYIIENRKPNRSRYLPKLENPPEVTQQP